MLDSTSYLVGLFHQATQRLTKTDNPGYKLRLLSQRSHDSRQYNDPSSDDISGLVIRDIGDYHSERDIIIEIWSEALYKGFQNCIQDLWPYNILFFPLGEDGYQTNISFANQDDQLSRKHQNVLMRAFYAYFIHEREYGEDNVTKGG